MTLIPLRDQVFPTDHVAVVLTAICKGDRADGEDLVAALEQLAGKRLPQDLTRYLLDLSSGKLRKPRGRPAKSRAGIDWIMAQVDKAYPVRLKHYQAKTARQRAAARAHGDIPAVGGLSPRELAYRDILKHCTKNKMVPNMTLESFMNVHSLWKSKIAAREFSEDFDLEFDARVDEAVSAIKRRRPPPLSP